MSLMALLGIATAYAAEKTTTVPAHQAPAHSDAGLMSMLPLIILFIVFVYFFLIRPQSKRSKEAKQLMDSLTVDAEVVTIGGIHGKVTEIKDNTVTLMVAKQVNIVMQKTSIATVLPKGTLSHL